MSVLLFHRSFVYSQIHVENITTQGLRPCVGQQQLEISVILEEECSYISELKSETS